MYTWLPTLYVHVLSSVNRRLVKLHGSSKEVIHKVPNSYATDERDLLSSQTLHNWSRQHETAGPQGVKIYGYVINSVYCVDCSITPCSAMISWCHLQSLYRKDSGKGTGLSLVPKLKFEHVNLTAFSKMRVDLAAKVSATRLNHRCSIEFTPGCILRFLASLFQWHCSLPGGLK